MTILIKNYGTILTSRPAGREAAMTVLAYEPGFKSATVVQLDFEGVAVMTPSWLSEFIQTLKEKHLFKVEFIPSENPTVVSSIEFIEPEIL